MKQAQVMISTANNVVNLMPMLMGEFGECTAVIISSAYASRHRWSDNLGHVLHNEGKQVEILDMPDAPEDFKAFSASIIEALGRFDRVYFNISGGKKSQLLSLLRIYQERNQAEDRLIYFDSNPFRLLQFKGLEFEKSYEPGCSITLENILNLQGYTCQPYPGANCSYALDLNKLEVPQEIIRKINKLFLQEQLFAKLMYSYFDRMAIKEDEKKSDRERVRSLVRKNKPKLVECTDGMNPKLEKSYKLLSKAIKELRKQVNSKEPVTAEQLESLWWSISAIPNVDDLFNSYWGDIRDRIVSLFLGNIEKEDQILIDDEAEIEEILKMCDWCDPDYKLNGQIRHSDVSKLLRLNKVQKGTLFENMFSVLVWDTIKDIDASLLNRLYSNVKIYRLDSEEAKKDDAKKQGELFAEFDLVFVTAHGTLLVFECKTFGMEGDIVKSKNWSTTSHGGILSETVLSTHVQRKHFDIEDRAESMFPSGLRHQLASTMKYTRDKLWFFDEVEEKLRKELIR